MHTPWGHHCRARGSLMALQAHRHGRSWQHMSCDVCVGATGTSDRTGASCAGKQPHTSACHVLVFRPAQQQQVKGPLFCSTNSYPCTQPAVWAASCCHSNPCLDHPSCTLWVRLPLAMLNP